MTRWLALVLVWCLWGCGATPAAAPADAQDADARLDDGLQPDGGATADTGAVLADAATAETVAADGAGSDGADGAPGADVAEVAQPPGPIDPASLPPADFAEVTGEYGIDPLKSHALCVAAADLDGNEREDMLVVERSGVQAALHAVLLGSGAPQHVWTAFDTTILLPTSGCTLADMDDDGHPDLLIGGPSGAALYLGDGKGGFTDQSEKWLPYIMDFHTWSIAPADLDGDGDLDLFVGAGSPSFDAANPGPGPACGAEQCGYQGHDFTCELVTQQGDLPELQDRVLIRGSKLPLVDATAAWDVPGGGIVASVLPADLDADGKTDILVSNDFGTHYWLRNHGDGFTAHAEDIGFYPYAHGMGWGMGDWDGDGLAELILADEGPVPLYRRTQPAGGAPLAFTDSGGSAGLWGPTWASSVWSPMVADFDHDGREDILFGSALTVAPSQLAEVTAACTTKDKANPYGGHPNIDVLMLAQAGGTFVGRRFPSGPESHFMVIAQAVLDLDGDGDLDLVQSRPGPSLTSRVRVFRNDMAKQGGSFQITVRGKPGNRDALGAVVTAQFGGQLHTRWLTGSGGFGSNRSRIAHFGLGGAAEATSVTVRWPDGKQTAVGSVAAGASVQVQWP